MTAHQISTQLTPDSIDPRIISAFNDCATENALATKAGQLDCDLCPVKAKCRDYWDAVIAPFADSSAASLRRLAELRRQKLLRRRH